MINGNFKDKIFDSPGLWRLYLRVGRNAVDAMAFQPGAPDESVVARIVSDPLSPLELSQIEAAVYDNPALLTEGFASVGCEIVDPVATVAVPGEYSPAQAEEIFRAMAPDSQAAALTPVSAEAASVRFVAGIDPALHAFLRRTFSNVAIVPHIAPLAAWFVALSSRGNSRKLFVNFREGAVDIVATERSRLLLANSFACTSASDAAYFVMAVRELFAMTAERGDTVMASGSGPHKAEALQMLRSHCGSVMPVIFPSELSAAGPGMTDVAFDLLAYASGR